MGYRTHLAAAILGATLCAPLAQAQTVTAAGGPNQDFTINFNGFTDTVNLVPGLTAFVAFDFISASVGATSTYTFNYTVGNTSSLPVTSSRVSGFGFNTNPDVNVGASSATGVFDTVSSGNVPILPGNIDICFLGGGGGQCAGGGGGGVLQGATTMGTLTLAFTGSVTSITLSDFFVRWQSLDVPSLGISGGSGVGTQIAVPAPLAGAGIPALLALGGGIWFARRRKQQLAA